MKDMEWVRKQWENAEGFAVAFDYSELAKIDCDLKYQANGPENYRNKADAIQGHSRSALEDEGKSLLWSFVRAGVVERISQDIVKCSDLCQEIDLSDFERFTKYESQSQN